MSYLFRFLLLILGSSCSQNVFLDLPDKNGDSYLIELARNRLDNSEWTNAISAITPVLESQPKNTDVVYLAAAAYAGRAGLRTLTLFSEIASKTSDGKLLFKILGEHLTGATRASNIKDLEIAISIIENYSTVAADRPAELNYFALFLYYAYLGGFIQVNAMTGSNNDIVGGFSACSSASLPHSDVDQMIVAFNRITAILTVIGNSAAGSIGNQFSYGFPSYDVGCPASGTDAVYCLLMRNLVNGNVIGLNLGLAVCL